MDYRFPNEFLWGAATAAPQIEGAADVDGKGESVWDRFARQPGAIHGGHTPAVACDFYHHWQADVEMMAKAGLRNFRFSLSWPRLIPDGTGKPNRKGFDFYDRLIDLLLAKGVRPFVTLFHWDYPQALQERGGWKERDSVEWFGRYAQMAAERFGDRVKDWITFNEPAIFLGHGHRAGTHAPGLTLTESEVFHAVHHVNLAHARAFRAIHDVRQEMRVGMAHVAYLALPADPQDQGSIEAARRATLEPHWTGDHRVFLSHTWWMDPVFLGRYPDSLEERHPEVAERVIRDGDLESIRGTADFNGYNYYFGRRIAANGSEVPEVPGAARTAFGWPLHADGLYWGPKFLHEAYAVPQLILENGISSMDWVSSDGAVHDAMRIDFLSRYLVELHRVMQEGVPVDGWFHWSWLDNFEWAEGYKERFGLVYVDYETQQRTPKDSLAWYTELMRSGVLRMP